MPRTVLIVEDEFLIALDLTLLLEGRGWSVLGPVASVEAALRLLNKETPAVALLDVNLTDGAGDIGGRSIAGPQRTFCDGKRTQPARGCRRQCADRSSKCRQAHG